MLTPNGLPKKLKAPRKSMKSHLLGMNKLAERILTLFLPFLLSSCDFYTLYFIKKSLEGDFEYIETISSKYTLKGSSTSDIPISEEEKILPEFTEDKISPLESEKDLFPGSREKVTDTRKIFLAKGGSTTIELPSEGGVWIVKKLPIRVASLDPLSPIKENSFIFAANNSGKDTAIFQLFSSNGTILDTKEFEINVVEDIKVTNTHSNLTNLLPLAENHWLTNTLYGIQTNPTGTSSKNLSNKSQTIHPNSSNLVVTQSNTNTNLNKKFDLTDNEKEETEKTNVVSEPIPPSGPAIMDLKTLVGDEDKFFENIDHIAKKYGYYRALREIEKIEPNVSQDDLPKLKLKKMELLGKLNKFSEAIKEGENFVDKDTFIKLYTGIFFGKAKNYPMADKHIKESLQKITSTKELSLALGKALEYYTTLPEPPTSETINFLFQKNELLQRDLKTDYYKNLVSIGTLYERKGEIYKARAVYEKVLSEADEETKEEVGSKITNLNKILDYK